MQYFSTFRERRYTNFWIIPSVATVLHHIFCTGAALIISEKMFYSIPDISEYKHVIIVEDTKDLEGVYSRI